MPFQFNTYRLADYKEKVTDLLKAAADGECVADGVDKGDGAKESIVPMLWMHM